MQQRGTHEAVPDRRNEDVLVYINGEFFRREEARISVFDSGFLVGDGVWEGLRLHEGDFAFLEEHIDRLFQGAKAIGLEIGMTRQEITAALHETARRNGMTTDIHVRLMVTRGDKKTPSQGPRLGVGGPNVVIIAEHKRADPEVKQRGVRLFTSTGRRPPPDTPAQRLNSPSTPPGGGAPPPAARRGRAAGAPPPPPGGGARPPPPPPPRGPPPHEGGGGAGPPGGARGGGP